MAQGENMLPYNIDNEWHEPGVPFYTVKGKDVWITNWVAGKPVRHREQYVEPDDLVIMGVA